MSIINETERKNLLTAMKKLLEEYDYEYTDAALNKIIDTWDANKAPLISAFKKHPNYVDGKFMIVFDHEYERAFNSQAINRFALYLTNTVAADCKNHVPKEIVEQRIKDGCSWLPDKLYKMLCNLTDYCAGRTIGENFAIILDELVPAIHVHNGEKTSRVINRLCKYLGYDKHENYNKEFAKFADALSPMTISQRVILSLNPIDYLTMSFGNSWASCHTIDKENKRGMPNDYSGCYSSGTISYMLDKTSMVLYVVDKSYSGTDYELQPKINRQMFHYGEDKLVQGRLYPQSNDSDNSAYEPYRQIVQEIMSTIFEFPNLWMLKKGTSAICDYIHSEGTHYRDYANFRSCSISKAKYKENTNRFVIGHDPICIECGDTHDVAENINCCRNGTKHTCQHCGRVVYGDDDVYWVNDEPYCSDCVEFCEICDEYYVVGTGHSIGSYAHVCDYCYEHAFVTCEVCGKLVRDYYSYHINDEDIEVCHDCAHKHYERCARCGGWFTKEGLNEDRKCKECEEALQITYDIGGQFYTASTGGVYTMQEGRITITTDTNDEIIWRY